MRGQVLDTSAKLVGKAEFKPRGSAIARGILSLFGWRVLFEGLPAAQGVLMVYPHTSNWDFVLGVLVKWATGVQIKFWGKDSLFKLPLFGAWVRWIGGVPVDRSSSKGMAGSTAAQMRAARDAGQYFWLAVAPEGTRSLTSGWRSGAYQVAVQAGVPVSLVAFNFEQRTVDITRFVEVTGDADADFALFARTLADARGCRHELASPICIRK
ncbi:MAG TPA: 1-acyl-sn-glycerol-3-phosphate acyltransferase [Burkholderiaceae bacterium]